MGTRLSRYRTCAEGSDCFTRRARRSNASRTGATQSALYDYAIKYGLIDRPDVAKNLPHLSELSVTSYARYPMIPVKPVAFISQYDDLIERIFLDVGSALSSIAQASP
jgi:hypothetical protein